MLCNHLAMQESPQLISYFVLLSMMYQMIVIRIKINSHSECITMYIDNTLYMLYAVFFSLSLLSNVQWQSIWYNLFHDNNNSDKQKIHLQQQTIQRRPTEPRILYSNLFCVKHWKQLFKHPPTSVIQRSSIVVMIAHARTHILCFFFFKSHIDVSILLIPTSRRIKIRFSGKNKPYRKKRYM